MANPVPRAACSNSIRCGPAFRSVLSHQDRAVPILMSGAAEGIAQESKLACPVRREAHPRYGAGNDVRARMEVWGVKARRNVERGQFDHDRLPLLGVVPVPQGDRHPKHQESATRSRLAPTHGRHSPFFAACAECRAISQSVRPEASAPPWTAHGRTPGHCGLADVQQAAAGLRPKRRHSGTPVPRQ